jgi:hypothetical protein
LAWAPPRRARMPRQSERLARALADVLRSDRESRPVATRAGGGAVNAPLAAHDSGFSGLRRMPASGSAYGNSHGAWVANRRIAPSPARAEAEGTRALRSGAGHQWSSGQNRGSRVPPLPAGLLIRRWHRGRCLACRSRESAEPPPVVPVQSDHAAPRLSVILALARSQPTSRGVRSSGSYFRSCRAE